MRMKWKFPVYFGGLVLALTFSAVSCTNDSTAPQQNTLGPTAAQTTQQKVQDLNTQYGWMGRFHTEALGYVYEKLSKNRGASNAEKCTIIGRAVKEFARTFRKAPGSVGLNTNSIPDNPCDTSLQLSTSRQANPGSTSLTGPRGDYAAASSLMDQMVAVFDYDIYSGDAQSRIYYIESVAASTLSGAEAGAVIGMGSIAISSVQYWDANQDAWSEVSGAAYNRLATQRSPSATLLETPETPRYGWFGARSRRIVRADITAGVSTLLYGWLAGPVDLEAAALRAAIGSAIEGVSLMMQ